jgi:hypothetical protein
MWRTQQPEVDRPLPVIRGPAQDAGEAVPVTQPLDP